ncbi:hypothetical protein SDC9_83571 [bioreactor metagenome]|uniref:Uncharacterized protein n=1 Tax=bioreactor metagenome TaxID=1076179 RepID=A0A644Z8I7_9ZZZZ
MARLHRLRRYRVHRRSAADAKFGSLRQRHAAGRTHAGGAGLCFRAAGRTESRSLRQLASAVGTIHIGITPCFDYSRDGGFLRRCFLLFPAFGCAYDKQQQKQITDGGEDVIKDRHFAHLAEFAQHGGFVDIGENIKVTDALGARFALFQARPRLVAAIYHIAVILLAVCHKPVALGNGAGAVFLRCRIISATVIAVHRTHDAISPYCQSQRGETQIHGKQQDSADKDEDG